MKRRDFLKTTCRYGAACGLIALGAGAAFHNRRVLGTPVWQIDPQKCTGCGGCAVNCVLGTSAAKCFHNFTMCGYCEVCTGFSDAQPIDSGDGAENQLCPLGAIRRRLVEYPYYEYVVDSALCVGCGKCVDGCMSLGNGSLYLQIDQNLCKQCNQCAIAVQCPAQAVSRISAAAPYILKEA